MYLSVTTMSVVMIYASYKAMTNVVTLYIIKSAVVDSEVVRGVKSARCSSTEYKFVRYLGGDWIIISYDNRISKRSLGQAWLRRSIKIIRNFTNRCMDAQTYDDAIQHENGR